MSGTPTEAEIQTQWKNAVNILEETREFIDGTLAGTGNLFDVLLQSLEGEHTPLDLPDATIRLRSLASAMIDQSVVLSFIAPCIREYAQLMTAHVSRGYGASYSSLDELFSALYEWFVKSSLSVKSRDITFDVSATLDAIVTNRGTGTMGRLTVDAEGFPMEACHTERKIWRCRGDVNTGVRQGAEIFELSGERASFDSVLSKVSGWETAGGGSGEESSVLIRSRHAGTGEGGSLLNNGSFSTFSATASPQFAGWTEAALPATEKITQDTTNYYRSHPGASTDGSLKMVGGSGTITLKQTIANMRVSRLDPNTPYFLRVMLNKTTHSAVGGTVTLRCGSVSAATTISALASNWAELRIGDESLAGSEVEKEQWFRNFNEGSLDVEIEWASSSSGSLLVDDMIFCPYDLVDGTYWVLRPTATTYAAWLVDDTLVFTDSESSPQDAGKIQYWLFRSGLGYLPTDASPTFTDP